MFNFREVVGIKNYSQITELSELNDTILLVPESLEDTVSKINQKGFYGIADTNFINGYAFLSDDRFLNRYGKVVELNWNSIGNNFSCDILLCGKEYIVGSTQKKLKIDRKFIKGKPFSEGLAPIYCADHTWVYINTNGKVASNKSFLDASCFFGGYAIVSVYENNETSWKIIDRNFNYVENKLFDRVNDSDNSEEFYNNLIYAFDNNPNLTKYDSTIKKIYADSGTKIIFIDLTTNLSIRVYEIIEAIAKKFDIKLINGNAREQLIDVISKVAAKGTYTLDLYSLEIKEVETVKGVRIGNNENKSVVSFDLEDIEMVRAKIKKDKVNGNE